MSYQFVKTEIRENVGILTISNPQKLNALSRAVVNDLSQALDDFENDEKIRVIVITGEGDRSFIAGADIAEFENYPTPVEARTLVRKTQLTIHKIEQSSKPVIAAINGYCLGGGLELALSCDIRYASEKAKLGQPEINLGIIPGAGGTQRLPRLIGKGKAKEMIFSGKPISAQEALGVQLVQKVFPHGELLTETINFANELAKKPPLALAAAKELIDKGYDIDMDAALVMEIDKFSILFSTEDKVEGVKSFLEKRDPKFVGK